MSIGSYKSISDMNAQYNAYMKLLTAQSNLQRANTEAFKRKAELGDTPDTRQLEEMDVYRNAQEKLLDIITQKKKARENVSSLFKRPADVNRFLDLLEKETSIDPSLGESVGNPYSLFNLYFGELQEKVKRFVGLTPQLLMKYYTRTLDEQKEDLLPKKEQLDSIKSALDQIVAFNNEERLRAAEMKEKLKTFRPLTEKELNRLTDEMNDPLKTDTEKLDTASTMLSSSPSPLKIRETRKQILGPPRTNKKGLSFPVQKLDEDLESLTRPELINILKQQGVKMPKGYVKKDDLIEMVRKETTITTNIISDSTDEEEKKEEESPKRGRPKRVVGKGIEVVKKDVDWYNAGVYRISRPLLEKGLLSVYYNKSLGRPNIAQLKQTIKISDGLKHTLKKLLQSGELHLPSFYKMSKSDQALLLKLLKNGKMIDVLEEAFGQETPKIHADDVEEALHRFHLIQGQINAGNNSPTILKELVGHVDTLFENGLLSGKDRVNIYKTIMSLS